MIVIAIENNRQAKYFESTFSKQGLTSIRCRQDDINFLKTLYDHKVRLLIADYTPKGLPEEAAVDLFTNASQRISVILIKNSKASSEPMPCMNYGDQITIISENAEKTVLATVNTICGLDVKKAKILLDAIPIYHRQIPETLLKKLGGLGVLTIDASSFNSFNIDYGSEVYESICEVLHDILFSMWGSRGAFRDSDVICRRGVGSNIYLVFMNCSRDTVALPGPGTLEQIADRISSRIYVEMWRELVLDENERRLPACIQTIPLIGVGYFGVLDNPGLKTEELIDYAIDASRSMAGSQKNRAHERQRELIQTLIQSKNFLVPHYQAIFSLSSLRREHFDYGSDLKKLEKLIFGFEALVRVNSDKSTMSFLASGDLDPAMLTPEVLFAMAKKTKIALELDQACIRLAIGGSVGLTGSLMVNILPRNLYHIEKIIPNDSRIYDLCFEVSETESIGNDDLMNQARTFLEANHCKIAADDFGRGYSSLERVLRLRPHLIKFDRSMIKGIDKDPLKQAYIQGLVTAAKILDTMILAEGVESWDEVAMLQQMGIDLVQGYFLHEPQPRDAILQQLKATSANLKMTPVA